LQKGKVKANISADAIEAIINKKKEAGPSGFFFDDGPVRRTCSLGYKGSMQDGTEGNGGVQKFMSTSQKEYGDRLGIRPKDLEKAYPDTVAVNMEYTRYANRHKEWQAKTGKKIAPGKMLQAMESLTPPVFVEKSFEQPASLGDMFQAMATVTKVKWLALDPLVSVVARKGLA
jgi:hypothetical protein